MPKSKLSIKEKKVGKETFQYACGSKDCCLGMAKNLDGTSFTIIGFNDAGGRIVGTAEEIDNLFHLWQHNRPE